MSEQKINKIGSLDNLQRDKQEAQAFIRKTMDDLRVKYPGVRLHLKETSQAEMTQDRIVETFHVIDITAYL